jgi:hypothetical protein
LNTRVCPSFCAATPYLTVLCTCLRACVRPPRIYPVLQYNFEETGDLDVLSMHAGLPAEKEKVVATHFFSAKAATPPQEEGWWTSEKVLVPESYLA